MEQLHRIPVQRSEDKLIVPIQYELTAPALNALKDRLFNQIQGQNYKGVAFDLSGLELIDAEELESLLQLMRTLKIVGLVPVLCGLSPGLTATIVGLDISFDALAVEADLKLALVYLSKL